MISAPVLPLSSLAAAATQPLWELGLGAGTLRQSWHQGGTWTWAAVGVKWKVQRGWRQSQARTFGCLWTA